MKDKSKYYKSLFMTYFDGCYGIDPEPGRPNTFTMGVCKLDYDESTNKLVVHLRRPGLLIGVSGRTIDGVADHLGIEIDIVEVNLLK